MTCMPNICIYIFTIGFVTINSLFKLEKNWNRISLKKKCENCKKKTEKTEKRKKEKRKKKTKKKNDKKKNQSQQKKSVTRKKISDKKKNQ